MAIPLLLPLGNFSAHTLPTHLCVTMNDDVFDVTNSSKPTDIVHGRGDVAKATTFIPGAIIELSSSMTFDQSSKMSTQISAVLLSYVLHCLQHVLSVFG